MGIRKTVYRNGRFLYKYTRRTYIFITFTKRSDYLVTKDYK